MHDQLPDRWRALLLWEAIAICRNLGLTVEPATLPPAPVHGRDGLHHKPDCMLLLLCRDDVHIGSVTADSRPAGLKFTASQLRDGEPCEDSDKDTLWAAIVHAAGIRQGTAGP